MTSVPRDKGTRWPTAGIGAAVAIGAAVQAVLWLVSEPAARFSDFYKAYYPVAESLWFDGAGGTWPLGETGAGSFVNLPIVGWLFVPLVAFGEDDAGWAYLVLGIAATAAIWWLLTRFDRAGRPAAPALLLLVLCNGPLVNSLREGNSTHFILLLLIAALLLLERRREYAAGIVVGFCALMKLPLLLFGLYFLVRGRWRVVAGGGALIALAAGLSLAVHGLDANVGWYDDSVAPFLGGVIPAFNVQSIDGFLMRLQTGTASLMDWSPHLPSPAHRIARGAIVAALLGGTFWLMHRAGMRPPSANGGSGDMPEQGRLEYVVVLNLAILISPISWSHYYLLLLLPWALYICGRLDLPDDATTRGLMWGGIVLSSLPVVILPLRADAWGELMARTVVSACLLGGLLTLAALTRGLWKRPASASP